MSKTYTSLIETTDDGSEVHLYETPSEAETAFVEVMRESYDYDGPDSYEEALDFWEDELHKYYVTYAIADAVVKYPPQTSNQRL